MIADLLYKKLWLAGLMQPLECGLLDVCVTESVFSQRLVVFLRILRAVFYGLTESDMLFFSPAVVRYIKSKEYSPHKSSHSIERSQKIT